jgi:hypothetical protein
MLRWCGNVSLSILDGPWSRSATRAPCEEPARPLGALTALAELAVAQQEPSVATPLLSRPVDTNPATTAVETTKELGYVDFVIQLSSSETPVTEREELRLELEHPNTVSAQVRLFCSLCCGLLIFFLLLIQNDLVVRALSGVTVGAPLLTADLAATLLVVLDHVLYKVRVIRCGQGEPAFAEVRMTVFASTFTAINDETHSFFALWPGFRFTTPSRIMALNPAPMATDSDPGSPHASEPHIPDTSVEPTSSMATGPSISLEPSVSKALEILDVKPTVVTSSSVSTPPTNSLTQGFGLREGAASPSEANPSEILGSVEFHSDEGDGNIGYSATSSFAVRDGSLSNRKCTYALEMKDLSLATLSRIVISAS